MTGRVPAPYLYIITDRHQTVGRPLVDVVTRALDGAGPHASRVAVQLREKDLSGKLLLALARSLRDITHAAGAQLFINDRVDIALAAGADGVHLGSRSLVAANVRSLTNHLRIAVSTHTAAEVEAAARAEIDFVVFGPVFATLSKGCAVSPTGTAALARVSDRGVSVLALGGVNQTNMSECRNNGATGIACIRAIMAAPDPAATVGVFLAGFNVIETVLAT